MGDPPAGPQGGGRLASLSFPSQESGRLLFQRLSKPIERTLNFRPPLAALAGVPSAAGAREPGAECRCQPDPCRPHGMWPVGRLLPTPHRPGWVRAPGAQASDVCTWWTGGLQVCSPHSTTPAPPLSGPSPSRPKFNCGSDGRGPRH